MCAAYERSNPVYNFDVDTTSAKCNTVRSSRAAWALRDRHNAAHQAAVSVSCSSSFTIAQVHIIVGDAGNDETLTVRARHVPWGRLHVIL